MKKSHIIALAALTLCACGGANQNQTSGTQNVDTTVTQNVDTTAAIQYVDTTNTQNIDTATVETPQCDVSTPDNDIADRVKQYAAKLPTAYADTVYSFYKSEIPDGDNSTDENYYFFPYKSGGFFVIVRICSMESGNVYNYDYHYNYINDKLTNADDMFPKPQYTDFVSDGNAADAERIAQLTDDFTSSYFEGVLSIDVLPSGLEEGEEFQEIEKYQRVTYKWNGEKFVKFKE